MFDNADLISNYSRKQAIEDGVLIDVTATARAAGILFPTAITAAVYSEYVKVPESVLCQDESGRLWDVLWLCRIAIRKANGNEVIYGLHVRHDNWKRIPPLVKLKAVCGPNDDASPCLTIMLPEED